ncbi:MAG: bifunctional folylpolyglutamate synthase/dihydrofolate synthase [Lachnospiraceae bacterium]|nr:bifunctional folylpolyglutamate synthase/dihydrofolate synthase [Lachnospiraceae bacterium]
MTYEEAVAYIEAHTWSRWKLGLSRTVALLERLGDPQKRLTFVHVGGSNGKGSTCAMVERILREAGYKTGFYPSPYIEDFRERIQVCGSYITEDALCALCARVRDAADAMEDHPTQFEIITAIGMLYFAEQNCDIVVLEVGLGGEFDATNVIDAPEVCVLTNIGLEHTEFLGNTLAKIAKTKAGIIKPGADVVLYENVAEVADVVAAVCEENGCRLRIARFDRVHPVRTTLDGQTFLWERLPGETAEKDAGGARAMLPDRTELTLALSGTYQLSNVAVALTVIEVLRARGWKIGEAAVRAGLRNVRWPARFEVLSREPLFILDGGHNPQCAEALAESIETYLLRQGDTSSGTGEVPVSEEASRCTVFLLGILADKNFRQVIRTIVPYAAEFVCVTPDSERALPAEELAALLRERGIPATPCGSVEEGVKTALAVAGGRPVVAFGSLYMAGQVRKAFRQG